MSNASSPEEGSRYWKKSLLGLGVILIVWFFVSFGCCILWRDWMDANMPPIGHAPFGFWMAQQGSIISFVILLVIYSFSMNKLDADHGFTQQEK